MKAYTQHHSETNDRARGADAILARQRQQAAGPAVARNRAFAAGKR
jgi:hypothetical protein